MQAKLEKRNKAIFSQCYVQVTYTVTEKVRRQVVKCDLCEYKIR